MAPRNNSQKEIHTIRNNIKMPKHTLKYLQLIKEKKVLNLIYLECTQLAQCKSAFNAKQDQNF